MKKTKDEKFIALLSELKPVLYEYNITAEQYLVLESLYKDKSILQWYSKVNPKLPEILIKLYTKNLITHLDGEAIDFMYWEGFYLTKTAKKLLNNKIDKSNDDQNLDWMTQWGALFPKKIIKGGYRISGNKNECLKRMKVFMNDHPKYTASIILEATKNYLDHKQLMNYDFTKKNYKFIYDSKSSDLELWCEALLEKTDEIQGSIFIDKRNRRKE